MPLFLKSIAPEIDIFGNRELFNFNRDPSSGESDSALTLINWFTPILNVNANSTFEFLTPAMKGFRFNHSLSTTGTFGNFNFEKYDRFGLATPLWSYDEVTGSFSMETNKITNLANGIANTDAVNLGQMDTAINGLGFSGLSTNGFLVRTAANTYASRSLAGGNGISITNTNGFSGNPTISLSNSYNTSANVTVNWWNLSVATDVLDYIISPSITYPILLQNITSGNSGTNNLRYWRTTSGLGDNTGANAYWNFSYYNQALGVDKVYMSIGIPQNSIYLNAKVDLSANDLITTGNISAQTGTLKGNNLATYNAGTISVLNSLAMGTNSITGLANPVNNQDAATKFYVDNSGILASNTINVNTSGGATNWLRRSINTTTSVQIFGITASSFILESNNGKSAGIGFDGTTDTCTIWTAGDSGWYLNIQDEDSANSRVAYVAGTGAWTTVSSAKRKHSIKEKTNNNILDRFLKLSVKTYGYKYDTDKNLSEKKKERIERKTNKMATGLVLEELFDIFPNCIPDYYNELFQEKDHNKKIDLANAVKDTANCGIDYNTLLCYFVMAFQEFVQKTNNTILELKGNK